MTGRISRRGLLIFQETQIASPGSGARIQRRAVGLRHTSGQETAEQNRSRIKA